MENEAQFKEKINTKNKSKHKKKFLKSRYK